MRIPPPSFAAVLCAVAVAAAGAGSAPGGLPQIPPTTVAIFVAPAGNDESPGTETKPLRSLQKALDVAQPGGVIRLAPGVYEPSQTRRSGLADAPIVITGMEVGRDAGTRFRTVIRGPRVVLQINHSHYRVQGLTIDGQPGIDHDRFPSDLSQSKSFKDSVKELASNSKLVYVGYAPDSRNVTGVVLDNLFLHGAGGECVRMRNNAFGNVISNSVIQWCGVYASGDDVARYRYHNGEGVYIGTSPKSATQPMYANDTSHDNVVRDSSIRTFGSECFQVKENAHHNLMQRVDCSANEEPLAFQGSNVELRGDHNTVEDSSLSGSLGVNLKIASDEPKYDKGGNAILRNRLLDAAGAHILFRSAQPMGTACSNTFGTARVEDKTSAFGRAAEPCTRFGPREAPTPAPIPSPGPMAQRGAD